MNLKKLVSIGLCFIIIVSILPISFVHGSALTSVSLSGSGITANSASTGAALKTEVNFSNPTAITTADTITVALNGMTSTASIDDTELGITGCTDNTESIASVGAGANPVIVFDSIACNAASSVVLTITSTGISTGASIINASATAAMYSISITTNNDFGAILFYVGSANLVTVTATVTPTISLILYNKTFSGEYDAAVYPKRCSLGVLATGTTRSCTVSSNPTPASDFDYYVKVGTNAGNGYTINYAASSANSGKLAASASIDINDVADGTVTANSEEYGMVLKQGANSNSGTVTRGATFGGGTGVDNNAYAFSATGSTQIISVDKANDDSLAANSPKILHVVAISSVTQTGNYSQTITYTASGNF